MGKDAALEAIQRFRRALDERGIRRSRIILYGSYATGEAREGSDIDLVVISPDFAGRGLWERINLMVPAIRVTHAPIEATALTPQEWESRDSIVVDYAANGIEV